MKFIAYDSAMKSKIADDVDKDIFCQNAAALQANLGYVFRRRHLLERALTHSSWANEARAGDKHNERQEFLGDAVLELCVSAELYKRFPQAREGDLTRLRSQLVSGGNLALLARELGLDKIIRLGIGEEKQGGREKASILENALEAVLGAIYEDGGYDAAQNCVNRIFSGRWPEKIGESQARDCKSLLQEMCQHIFHGFPVYALIATHGAEHAKIFDVSLTLPDGRKFLASNTSCRRAEQDAAANAIAQLNRDCP